MSVLPPAEWARLKECWNELQGLDESSRRRRIDAAGLTPAAQDVLESMLALDDSEYPHLDRPAHELLGLSGERAVDASAAFVGRRVGPYRILRLVGRGGMGAVYEAERADEAYQQRVAIKTLWRGVDSDVLMRRFRSERQILAGLQHPNIAQLIDGGSTPEGTPWLALEFVEGTPIDEWCDTRALGIPERLDLFRQVCAAVQHAHRHLVVHRDLKPSNVLVTDTGVVKLLDFGVAKLLRDDGHDGTLTSAGFSPFTAAWAAPEQLAGGEVSTQADVFSLGALLTHLLTGEPPRDPRTVRDARAERSPRMADVPVRTPSQIVGEHMGQAVAQQRGFASTTKLAAALRGELDAIAAMAMRDDPARRYARVDDMADDVLRYLRRDRVLARPDSVAYRVWSAVRRRPTLSAVVGGAGVLLLGAAGITWQQSEAAKAEGRRAERATAFLSGLVMGSDAVSYDALVPLGPNGTVSQLLDSALVRIPREFADDARIRSRLYTAIGANLLNQGRTERAMTVLDSATVLAERGYGTSSPEYARALVELATLQLDLDGPVAIERPLTTLRRIAAAHPEDRALQAQLRLLLASQAVLLGRFRQADTLAVEVLAIERGQRSRLSVRAQAMRAYASSWITLDPRDYLVKSRAVLRLTDSLGMRNTREVVTALFAEFESLQALGRVDDAKASLERLRRFQLDRADSSAAIRANLAAQQAYVAGATGDTVARAVALAELRAILASGPRLPGGEWVRFEGPIIDDAIRRADTSLAMTEARRLATKVRRLSSPLLIGFGMWYLGQAQLASRDFEEALRTVNEGKRWVEPEPDIKSLLPLLRRVQYQTYKAMGRLDLADSLKRSVANPGPFPPCTPGGNWVGCPDLPPDRQSR